MEIFCILAKRIYHLSSNSIKSLLREKRSNPCRLPLPFIVHCSLLNLFYKFNKELVRPQYPVASQFPDSSAYTFAKSYKTFFYVRDESNV